MAALQAFSFKSYCPQRSVATNAFTFGAKPGYYIYHSVGHLSLLVPFAQRELAKRCMSHSPENLPMLQQQKSPAPNSQLVGSDITKDQTHSSFFGEHPRSVVRSISGADMHQPFQPPFFSSGMSPSH